VGQVPQGKGAVTPSGRGRLDGVPLGVLHAGRA